MNGISEKLNALAESWSFLIWNSSWQSALLVVLMIGVVSIGKKLPSSIRYSILVVALLKFAVPPFFALPTGVFSALPESQIAQAVQERDPAPGSVVALQTNPTMPPIRPEETMGPRYAPRDLISPSIVSAGNPPVTAVDNDPMKSIERSPAASVPIYFGSNVEESAMGPATVPSTKFRFPQLTIWTWLMLTHLAGSAILVVSICVSMIRLSLLSRRAKDVVDTEIVSAFQRLCKKFELKTNPRLIESDDIAIPISFGCFRPTVVLPTGLVSQKRFAVIAMSHELAHHRRLDPWVNWLQNVLLVVWWFNPMIWFLNRQIRRIREDCCDDLLLEKQLTDSETYGHSLIEIAKFSSNRFTGTLATAIGMTDHSLTHRIRRIMDPSVNRGVGISWRAAILLLFCCLICLPGLRNTIATNADEPNSDVISPNPPAVSNPEVRENVLPDFIAHEMDDLDSNQDSQSTEVTGETEKLIRGRIAESGEAATGAKILLFRNDYKKNGTSKHVQIAQAPISKDGTFEIAVENDLTNRSEFGSEFVAICQDSNGNPVGGKSVSIRLSPKSKIIELPAPIQIHATKAQTVSIVDEHDNPIVDAEVKTLSFGSAAFAELKEARRLNHYTESFDLPSQLIKPVKSNQQGQFTLPQVSVNGTSTSRVTLSNGAAFVVSFGPGPVKLQLDSSASIQGTVECNDESLKMEDVSIRFGVKSQSCLFEKYVSVFWTKLEVNSDGHFEIPHAMPGTYEVRVECSDQAFYNEGQADFVVASGEAKTLSPILFQPGIPLKGRVLDAESGAGVAGVSVNLHALKPGQRRGFWSHYPKTNDNGDFIAYVPPATLNINYSNFPPEYLQPAIGELINLRSFDATTGQPEYQLPKLKLRKGITIRGTVVDINGAPVERGTVWALSGQSQHGGESVLLKDEGKFEIEGVDPDDFVVFRATSGDRVTNGGITIDPGELDGEIKLVLAEEYAFKVVGKFVDYSGNPIAAIKVELRRNVSVVSRSGRGRGFGSKYGDYVTDSEGNFQSQSLIPGDRYHIRVAADGYASFTSPELTGEAGKVHDFGTIKLARTNLVATGQVVDSSGNPVSHATVFNSGDAPLRVESKTDRQGNFSLTGLPEGPAYIFVEKQGFRFAGRRTVSLDQPLRIEIRKNAEPPAERSGTGTPYTFQQRKEICKYMLEKLYALPGEQRADINFVLLRYMGTVDPALAMKWASDPANKSRRDDVTIEIAKALIDEDPEEALSLIGQVPSGRYFGRIMQLAERLVDRSPDVAEKLAVDLQARLDTLQPPDQIYNTAQLGNLLLKLGKVEAGKKLINTAFETAEQLPGEGRESFVKGYTAELLAATDLDRSLKLIEQMKDTQGTSKIRHLGNLAAMMAESNPKKAIEFAAKNNGRYAPRVAYRIAKSDRDLAQSVVQMLLDRGEQKYACEAMVGIALACHEADRERAYELIDQSFEIYMSLHQDFDSWSNFGCEAAPAGFTAAIARKIGYPDISSLVMKTLASRRGAKKSRSEMQTLKGNLMMAKYLALSDRNASRQLLEQLEQRPDLMGGGGYATLDQKDWLIAWCLTDIEKAKSVFDKMLEKDSKENPVMRQNHITRVFMDLTLPDEMFFSNMSRSDGLWYPGRE